MGNGSVIVPGDVQRMSAGRGVLHSEFNPSRHRARALPADLDRARGARHSRVVRTGARRAGGRSAGKLALLAAPAGEGGAVAIHQDARVYAGLFDGDEKARCRLAPGRRAYVHVARGSVVVNDTPLGPGDAAKLESETDVRIGGGREAEVLVFDLP